MLLGEKFSTGDLNGTIYDFQFVNDILPEHEHDETNVHVTVVCRGKIKAYNKIWSQEAVAGQIINFKVGEPHEIMALENNTRIINIVKKLGGISNDYIPPK